MFGHVDKGPRGGSVLGDLGLEIAKRFNKLEKNVKLNIRSVVARI